MARPAERHASTIVAIENNWRTEMEGAATYRWLVGQTDDPRQKEVLSQLAAAEERHAERWAERLRQLGVEVPSSGAPDVPPSLRARAGSGISGVLRALEAREEAHLKQYEAQARLHDAESASIMRELAQDEGQHAGMLRTMAGAPASPQGQLNAILNREKHAGAGSWLGDAIYGANDGLGAVFGLIAGVSGANVNSHVILLAGVAGAVASAVSMGAGAYLATKSEREVLDAQLAHERQEMETNPAEEKEELSLFYQLRGMTRDEADRAVERVSGNPQQFLDALAHDELGIRPDSAGSPWTSAISAAVSTAAGAAVPVIPFVFLSGAAAIITAFIVSLIGHFIVGALKSMVTTRPWWSSGLEMTMIGVLVGAVTYAVGYVIGVG